MMSARAFEGAEAAEGVDVVDRMYKFNPAGGDRSVTLGKLREAIACARIRIVAYRAETDELEARELRELRENGLGAPRPPVDIAARREVERVEIEELNRAIAHHNSQLSARFHISEF